MLVVRRQGLNPTRAIKRRAVDPTTCTGGFGKGIEQTFTMI
jgi:hypothetical protein